MARRNVVNRRSKVDNIKAARFFVGLGRIFAFFAFLALVSAWITQWTGEPLMGMSQEHLFRDATVLSLLSIIGLLDGLLHSRNL